MSDTSTRVLVLDADGQAGLSIVRSLGQRGVSVTAGSPHRLSLGRLSRYSDASYVSLDPDESSHRFISHLVDYLESTDHLAVIPVRDGTSVLLSKHKAELEETGTIVAIEDWETFELTYDKGRFFELAESLQLPIPKTFAPSSLADVEGNATTLSYPALVKPRSKTVRDTAGRCHYTEIDDAHYVDSPAELVETYRQVIDENPSLEELNHYPLVQEYIQGTTVTTVILAEEGRIVSHFQEERVRTYPASGGNSTVLRAIREPQMLEYAADVVDALEWTGPVMVEFMDTRASEHFLIEANGRYWGSVPFAIESGVDVPWMHYCQLRGKPIEPPRSYRTDVLHHRLLNGDLKWLAEQLRLGNPTAVFQALWTCFVANQTFVSRRDPLPTIAAPCRTVELGGRVLARRVANIDPQFERSLDAPYRQLLSYTERRGWR